MTETTETPGVTPTLAPKPEPTPDQWYIDRRDALLEGDTGQLPGGQTCAEQRDEYAGIAETETAPAVPTLDSINPATATVGATDMTLQAIGSDFTDDSVIVWNNAIQTTALVSMTELQTLIDASFLAAAGTVSVLVRRPQVGDSAAKTFTIS